MARASGRVHFQGTMQARPMIAVLIILLSLPLIGAKSLPCKIGGFNFEVVRPREKDGRAHFLEASSVFKKYLTEANPTIDLGTGAAVEKQLKAYLVSGDLVRVPNRSMMTNFGNRPTPVLVCAQYRSSNGHKIRGWMKSSDLVEATFRYYDSKGLKEVVFDSKAYRRLRDFLKTLQPSKLLSGTYMRKASPGELSWKLILDSKAKDVSFDGGVKMAIRDRIVPMDLKDKCPVNVMIFNNAILVRTWGDAECYGNHGGSDPAGVYYFHR